MRKNKNVFFVALLLWTGIFFMAACGGNGVDNGDGTPPPSPPSAPTIEDIYTENRELAILWDVVNNANTYNLYWNTTGGVTTSDNSVTSLRTPYYVHAGLSLFKTYSYAVTAVNAGGASSLSNEMSALPAGVPEELWKRIAPDAQNDDVLGSSVAVSGDYAVAGAVGEDGGGGGTNQGAAYIFERNYGGTNNWGYVKKLTASDAEDSANFGYSVAIDGDYIVVGAYSKDDGLNLDRGAAYVFERNYGGTNNWGQVAKLMASDGAGFDEFGWSVAISGDYVVVGAHREDGGGSSRGAAYVFGRNQGGPDAWGEVEKLTAGLDAENLDRFGTSVGISGDNVVVGAHYEDGIGTDYGAAYVFGRNQGGPDNWGQVTKLTAAIPENAAYFGYSVAVNGDFAIVGAYGEDSGGTNRGAVYVFDRDYGGPDAWGQVAKLTASDDENGDEFGSSVSIDGDYAIVGTRYEDGGGTSRGAAYIYYRNQGLTDSWGEVMKL
ncbi:MAG: FG-GAP repeat protein, partial [Candidatus Aminicenantes bacterium]|nr:FG-GAP repeat protein [Candidatus Aminicenantes bacterium]